MSREEEKLEDEEARITGKDLLNLKSRAEEEDTFANLNLDFANEEEEEERNVVGGDCKESDIFVREREMRKNKNRREGGNSFFYIYVGKVLDRWKFVNGGSSFSMFGFG